MVTNINKTNYLSPLISTDWI